MKYEIKIDYKDIEVLENQEKYLDAINLIINEVKYNYEMLIKTDINYPKLSEIYSSISYLGRENGLMPETERRILKLVKLNRERFKEIYNITK